MLTAVDRDIWIAAWNPERLVVAHGEWVRSGGRDVLERALAWMG
jgi:hypothetical protein